MMEITQNHAGAKTNSLILKGNVLAKIPLLAMGNGMLRIKVQLEIFTLQEVSSLVIQLVKNVEDPAKIIA